MKKLGFGLMRLPLENSTVPGSIDYEKTVQMMDAFLQRGFTYFDTAYMYHNYQSEIAARELLVKRHPRNSFTLTSKLPVMFLKERDDMERIFNEQLEKCGVEYFDYYILHGLDADKYETVQRLGCFEFIQKKRDEGKIRSIGISFHDTAQLLDRILTDHPETEMVQLQINYLDWENPGIQSRQCYEVARHHGKEIVVMEPVKGGTLANVPNEVEELFKGYAPSASLPSWAIRFAASLPGVLTVLSGMGTMEQLSDNMSYMENFEPLNTTEQALIEQSVGLINASVAIPCTACNYCTEICPKQIPIPNYFSLYNAEKRVKIHGFSVHGNYYRNFAADLGKASDCINCRQCEKLCPQHLPIPEYLKSVAETFE